MTGAVDGTHPGRREMQAGCVCGNALYITGGRNLDGEVLADTWSLNFNGAVTTSPAAVVEVLEAPVVVAQSAGPVVVDITKNFGRFTEGDVHGEPVPHSVGVIAGPSHTAAITSLTWECRRFAMMYLAFLTIFNCLPTVEICSYRSPCALTLPLQHQMDTC